MSIKNLLDPIIEQGIRNTNFFEGRLLSGEDLRNQHNANRQHDRYLGQAIGQGIINGLEVELDNGRDGSDGEPPVVTVKKGLAINAEGEAIGLPGDDIKLALSRSIEKPTLELADFYACAGPPDKQHIPNGAGVYILVMSPVAGFKERALKSGLGDGGVASGCGSKYIQEGVEFRLVEVAVDDFKFLSEDTRDLLKNNLLSKNDPVLKNNLERLSMLRNIIAHAFFGTEKAGNYYNMSNDVISECFSVDKLSSCDVPVCVLYWTLGGVAFVDMWSVRRKLNSHYICGSGNEIESYLRLKNSESMLFQFQDHLDMLSINRASMGGVEAKKYFRYLPPAGIVPLSYKLTTGYNPAMFFKSIPHRDTPGFSNSWYEFRKENPQFIDGDNMVTIFSSAINYPPIDLNNNKMVWLYFIWQQIKNLESGSENIMSIVFTNSSMKDHSVSRFDVSRWDYSNFSSVNLTSNSGKLIGGWDNG